MSRLMVKGTSKPMSDDAKHKADRAGDASLTVREGLSKSDVSRPVVPAEQTPSAARADAPPHMDKPSPALSSEQKQGADEPVLVSTRANPIPDGVHAGFVLTDDDMSLRYARWPAVKRPMKGTVLILQGRSEYIEKYFETVEDLRAEGFEVLTFDWRGQGGSDRLLDDPKRGHIEHFDQYLMDLDTIMTKVALPDCRGPFFVLAHSMGGLIALLAAPGLGNRISRMVVLAPMLALQGLPVSQRLLRRFTGLMTFIGFAPSPTRRDTSNALTRPFLGNKLTNDIERFQRNRGTVEKRESLVLSGPTFGWTYAACQAMETVHEDGFSSAIAVPTLLVAAGADEVVRASAVEAYGRKMRAGAFLTVTAAKHELLHERDILREQALAAFFGFVPGSSLEDLKNRRSPTAS
ncbi:MAG: alpha/beta hydrolase [Pseudomonadota bacterium]